MCVKIDRKARGDFILRRLRSAWRGTSMMNALELAGRAYVIDHGRVTKSGAAMGLANDPAIREAIWGCPR